MKIPDIKYDSQLNLLREDVMKQKIPVLFYSSLEQSIIRKFLLNCNLNDFIVEGDTFLIYKKVVNFIKKSTSKN